MIRVTAIVEGETEKAFVREVLSPHLSSKQLFLTPILVGKRGGLRSYGEAKGDIIRSLKQDRTAHCTTMFDFFRLPRDFPGLPVTSRGDSGEKAREIEAAVSTDIQSELGGSFDPARFIPYIQMHEFEALLFSDARACAEALYRPKLEGRLKEIRDGFGTPEDIDDGPETAPSKRILGIFDRYQKPVDGCRVCLETGLHKLMAECGHFREWVHRLEALGGR